MIAAALLFTVIMKDSLDRSLLVLWVGSMIFFCGVRLFIWKRYNHNEYAVSPEIWVRRYLQSTLVVGLLWASLSLFLYFSDDLVVRSLVFMMIIGAIAASVPVLSSILPAFYAYITPMTVGLATAFILEGSVFNISIGVAVPVYAALIAQTAINTNRHLRDP
ncbi:MAG: hypothetical protein M3H12_00945 [Chromatiales bacterium]|nr:hypothetical protein [Gammaproteobacteria bacterium]